MGEVGVGRKGSRLENNKGMRYPRLKSAFGYKEFGLDGHE